MTPQEAKEVKLPTVFRPIKRAREIGRLATEITPGKNVGWAPGPQMVITRRRLIELAEVSEKEEENMRIYAEVTQRLEAMTEDTHQRIERIHEALELREEGDIDGEDI